MASQTPRDLAGGWAALANADWLGAKAAFQAALHEQDSPEAHDGLGIALWWLNDIAAAHDQRAIAYAQYRRRGDYPQAALIAVWLAREQIFLHANASAMNGWFARADRLLKQCSPGREHAWCALFRASMAAPEVLEPLAFETIEVARRYDDTDLEVAALAFGGMARVALGRVGDGMNCLDEAMAAATGGEVENFMIVSEVFCVTLSACELSGDLVRTEHWRRAASDFANRYRCSFLSAYCRTTYGALLTATGRWREAEVELAEAIRAFESGHRGLRVHAVLKLAELRIYQNRLEEAGVLLRGYEDHAEAVLPLARLHLARREPEIARALLDQALHASDAPQLGQAPLLSLGVEVSLMLGDLPAARAAAERLAVIAEQARSDVLLAQAELARGHVTRYDDESAATGCFRSALAHVRQYEQSLLASRVKLELARTLKASDPAGALVWARAALATFERLGASHEADQAANLLRDLGAIGRVRPSQHEPVTPREAEVLALLARGLTNREIAERLVISAKTVEHHVSQILGKLGLRSRAEAAAYATQNQLSETA